MTLHPGFVSSLSFPFQGQIQEIQKEGAEEIVARVLTVMKMKLLFALLLLVQPFK